MHLTTDGNPVGPLSGGLYRSSFEKDSCGVGLVCSLRGEPSHGIVRDALTVLANLAHRGATGADPRTGDGAGILIQIPDRFFRARMPELEGVADYGVGVVFLPLNAALSRRCQKALEESLALRGISTIAWRSVPLGRDVVGDLGAGAQPDIRQIFVRRPEKMDDRTFERELYIARRLCEQRMRRERMPDFYIPSLSGRTVVYKGLMLSDKLADFYPDLADDRVESVLALVHQRYSTNTFPAWRLAQPFRFLCHNGEINTLRGNRNWMKAREGLFSSESLGAELAELGDVLDEQGSDSACLDNAVELLYHAGRSLPHAVMMLIPEAWQHNPKLSPQRRAFCEYHACLTETWDGPASIPFTDGHVVGALLDRNGLRPSRYTVTKDGRVVMGSETGVLDIAPENVLSKGRLEPGKLFLVDMDQGRIVADEEIKETVANQNPYAKWLNAGLVRSENLPTAAPQLFERTPGELIRMQAVFGYSAEDLKVVLAPMARLGAEAIGSMGNDTPLAVLSEHPRLLYDYFHQKFAQVTNPPLDAIREEIVTSLDCYLGTQGNLLEPKEAQFHLLHLPGPVISEEMLARLCAYAGERGQGAKAAITYPRGSSLEAAIEQLCAQVEGFVRNGKTFIVLSDRDAGSDRWPIPALLAVSAVHHHLVRARLRTRAALVLDSGDPREVHHFAALLGYGVDAVCPYLAFATLRELARIGQFVEKEDPEVCAHFIKAVHKGILKVMSKMGISTLQSYRGAQIFEAVGLSERVVERFFAGTLSRVGGLELSDLENEIADRQAYARSLDVSEAGKLAVGGLYQFKREGEAHQLNPATINLLQQAVRTNDRDLYNRYAEAVVGEQAKRFALRSLLRLRSNRPPVSLQEVEPWTSIVRRFKTGAMSYGSLSAPAHEALAIAMNRIGGKSNCGEGGEDPARFIPEPNGDSRCSAIKQIASGRFGVTSHYLVNAAELQIKMAQGAKPGEGGQLPAEKVYPWIAKVRMSTPHVQLISPPPHHDIYSIEDLAQLIFDLKSVNPAAAVSVKLVAEAGVGTVAAGVAKAKADGILISGWDGGTGASALTGMKHAGMPWEMGLAEAHQTLRINGLRDRVRLECDGKLLTGRDVAIACLLGAEEFGFGTAPLIALGCVMARVCHLNTCPKGIATQDPKLIAKFRGSPEHVINFMRFVAEDLRQIMANLGFRTIDEMVGHMEVLDTKDVSSNPRLRGLDLRPLLANDQTGPMRFSRPQSHELEKSLDNVLIERCNHALEKREPISFEIPVRNIHRSLGAMLGGEISRRWGAEGLPDETIHIKCIGSGGQSFGAFIPHGLTLEVEGDANDYLGKGLSGGRLIVYPSSKASFVAAQNVVIGNVALYGATGGECFVRGLAGERFAVRNSGAVAVVEGLGDHGCEYMTGGRVVVLGQTGRNFAAGMSGGIAYVYDPENTFVPNCNTELVDCEHLEDGDEIQWLKALLQRHAQLTGSTQASALLEDWEETVSSFKRVIPHGYRKALETTKM